MFRNLLYPSFSIIIFAGIDTSYGLKNFWFIVPLSLISIRKNDWYDFRKIFTPGWIHHGKLLWSFFRIVDFWSWPLYMDHTMRSWLKRYACNKRELFSTLSTTGSRLRIFSTAVKNLTRRLTAFEIFIQVVYKCAKFSDGKVTVISSLIQVVSTSIK